MRTPLALGAFFSFSACGLFAHTDGGAMSDAGAPDAGHAISAALTQCAAMGGAMPRSIAEVVARLNALPHPTGAACFVASLPRPLSAVATVGVVSAQPAGGAHDPRVFLMGPGVVMAVVPAGPGSVAMELGQWVTNKRTLKAEIVLPVTSPIPDEQPFAHLEATKPGDLTACGFCHHHEESSDTTPHGYVSAAYRPLPFDERPITALAAEHDACVASGDTSARCDLYHALFDFGEFTQGAFAADVEYFAQ